MNQKLRIIGILLSPSLLSVVIIALLVIASIVSTFVKYGLNTTSVYSLVLGPGSTPDLINSTQLVFSLLYQNIFGNPTLNKILFFAFWMLVGLVVYLFLMLIAQSITYADDTAHEMNYVHNDKIHFLEQHIKRFGVHLGVLVAISLYSILFLKALLPYSLLSIQIGTASLPKIGAFGYVLLGIFVQSISLYFYVILLRLFFLRVRVFRSE